MAEKRPDSYVEDWLSQLKMPVIRIDGTAKDLQPAQIVEACESNSLFSERCIVLVNEPYFLNAVVFIYIKKLVIQNLIK